MLIGGFLIFTYYLFCELEPHLLFPFYQEAFQFRNTTERVVLED